MQYPVNKTGVFSGEVDARVLSRVAVYNRCGCSGLKFVDTLITISFTSVISLNIFKYKVKHQSNKDIDTDMPCKTCHRNGLDVVSMYVYVSMPVWQSY